MEPPSVAGALSLSLLSVLRLPTPDPMHPPRLADALYRLLATVLEDDASGSAGESAHDVGYEDLARCGEGR